MLTKSFPEVVSEARERVSEISTDQLRETMASSRSGWVLVDVREADEVGTGKIPGASHIPRGVLEGQIEHRVPDRGTKIVLYCRTGNRSVLAADSLQAMGYRNVVSLAGGFIKWSADTFETSGTQ